jgi:hypothetical protein
MDTEHHKNLTSAEIAQLWSTYMNDSMAICVLSYYLKNTQDIQISTIIKQAIDISKKHTYEIERLFVQENYAVPLGFTEDDVTEQSPPLFYDTFFLYYLKQMSRVGMAAYSLGLSLAARKDIRNFYHVALQDSMDLDDHVTTELLNKGLYIRAPYIVGPKENEFVEETQFLGGIIGKHRPLLTIEIAHLYGNIQTNVLSGALCIGFSQVAKSKEVTKYLLKTREIVLKHIDMLGDKLKESQLKVPMTWNDSVTESTSSPFSDKLMIFHINAVMATSLADYGLAFATSMRKDLHVTYTSIIAEVGTHLESGTKLMIKNGWLEKPPQTSNRDELAKKSSN